VNQFNFVGRLAAAPARTQHGDTTVCKFTVISNDYAGKNDQNESTTQATSIQFTAFNKKAQAIADNFFKGDQIILMNVRLQNNTYTDGKGNEVFGYNFIVDDFDFGAPGPEKREQLAKRRD
jgi:single-strand DNA-binding protein